MLYADKQALETDLKVSLLAIRERELERERGHPCDFSDSFHRCVHEPRSEFVRLADGAAELERHIGADERVHVSDDARGERARWASARARR